MCRTHARARTALHAQPAPARPAVLWRWYVRWPAAAPLTEAAHVHHARELIVVHRLPVQTAIGSSVFQLAYTYLFGLYATWALLQSRCLIGPILSHMLCNAIGFPQLYGRLFGPLWHTAAYYALLAGGLYYFAMVVIVR